LGFPICGLGREGVATADFGSWSLGSARESENAPLAERCFPYLGFSMRIIVA
jgi:hypothetical protein